MDRKRGRIAAAAAIAAVVALAWYLLQDMTSEPGAGEPAPPEEPPAVGRRSAERVTGNAVERAPLAVERPAAGSDDGRPRILVHEPGRPAVARGAVLFMPAVDAPPAAPVRAAVENGRVTDPPSSLLAMLEDRARDGAEERLRFVHPSGSVSRFARIQTLASPPGWELLLGSRHELTVRVSDLRGEPVAGAAVRAFTGLQISSGQAPTTDAEGRATVVLHASGGEAQLVVGARGYARAPRIVELDGPRTVEFALPRILAAGVVYDLRRTTYTFFSTPEALASTPVVSRFEYGAVLDPIEVSLGLAPHEFVSWHVYREPRSWVDAPRATLSWRRPGEESKRRRVLVKHIVDPTLRPERLPLDAPPARTARLDLRIASPRPVPDDAWLPWLYLIFERPDGSKLSGSGIGTAGRLVTPGRYRYWLEPGTYRVRSVDNSSNLKAGVTAEFLPVPQVALVAGENEPMTLEMRPEWTLMRFDFVGEGGFPVALHASVNVDGGFPSIGPEHSRSYSRYVRRDWAFDLHACSRESDGLIEVLDGFLLTDEDWGTGGKTLPIPEQDPSSGVRYWLD